MRKIQGHQYNTDPNKSRINVNLGAHLLHAIDKYRDDLESDTELPKVSRSVAISHLLKKAKARGLFNEFTQSH